MAWPDGAPWAIDIYISNPPAGEHAKSKSTQPSVTLWIIAHVRPVLSLPHSLSVRRPSQNGSIGISGIFPQAKLMMMVVVVVERHRCSRFARARVHSRIGLKREIEERRGEGIGVFNPISFVLHFSLGRRPHRPAAVSGEIKIVGRKALRSWCE